MFEQLDKNKKIAFLSMLSIILIGFAILAFWVLSPKYAPLFENLSEVDAATTIASLEENNVAFEIINTPNGSTILVPDSLSEQLKITMSNSLGLLDIQGLELFDNADYSMTDFTQDVTYKRAIQGELARTIGNMPGIKNARVHVTFAPKRLFTSDQQSAKASVHLETSGESTISIHQVSGIKKLVANSIERLTPENVAVFDFSGQEFGGNTSGASLDTIDHKHQAKLLYEQTLLKKAFRLLSLSFPSDRFAIAVDVALNFDKRKQTVQGYATDNSSDGVILKRMESTTSKENVTTNDDELSPMVLSKQSETEYTHGRETNETEFSSGEITNINVGIALKEALNTEQLASLSDVLSAGLGINKERGDTISVQSVPDFIPTVEPITPQQKPNTPEVFEGGDTQLNNENVIWYGIPVVALLSMLFIYATYRMRAINHKRREALLLELTDWLIKEEKSNVRA